MAPGASHIPLPRFTAMVERPSARKSALAKLVLSAPKPLQPVVYLG